MKLYLDASAIISHIEGVARPRDFVRAKLAEAEAAPAGILMTSRLSRLECRMKPLRDAQTAIIALYDGFFDSDLLSVLEIDAAVIEQATLLRAKYNLKSPDAIHVATAIEGNADMILTGDKDMLRCQEIPVEFIW